MSAKGTKGNGGKGGKAKAAPMPTRTLAALRESIAHWGRMMEFGSQSDDVPDGTNCALCRVSPLSCHGCPVALSARLSGCRGTPYHDARRAWLRDGLDSASFKTAAAKELAFLIGLIPTAKERAALLKRYRITKEGARA